MPKPTKGPRLGGGPAHERLMLANLATALFTHGRIQTTETKAKRLRPLAERLVTFAKRGDLHARRRVMTVIRDKSAVHKLFTEIAPLVEHREGGYTRVVKTGFRKGDNAPMAVIELVLEPVQKKPSVKKAAVAEDAPKVDDTPTTEDVVSEESTESVEVDMEQAASVSDEAGSEDAEQPAAEEPAEEQAPAEDAVEEAAAEEPAEAEDSAEDEQKS